jgi:hypothetical protein
MPIMECSQNSSTRAGGGDPDSGPPASSLSSNGLNIESKTPSVNLNFENFSNENIEIDLNHENSISDTGLGFRV